MGKLAYICLILWSFVAGYELGTKRYKDLSERGIAVAQDCVEKLESVVKAAGL